jgi:hypothetical protein
MQALGFAKIAALFSLRNAAAAPLALLLFVGAGAYVGSFSTSRLVARLFTGGGAAELDADGNPRKRAWTATAAAAAASAAAVAAREVVDPPLWRPRQRAAPAVASGLAAWRHAISEAVLDVRNYPFKHRFLSLFVAGAVGGVAYAIAEDAPRHAHAPAAVDAAPAPTLEATPPPPPVAAPPASAAVNDDA